MSVQAYSRSNPRYRRLYKCRELRNLGFIKFKEELDISGDKVLVYVKRRFGPVGLHIIKEARIWPDGSTAITEFD